MRRMVIGWVAAACAVLVYPMLSNTPLIILRADDGQSLGWFGLMLVNLLLVCMAFGWQRREFPRVPLSALGMFILIGGCVPLWNNSLTRNFIVIRGDWLNLVWLSGSLVLVGLLFVWIGWRWRRAVDMQRQRARIVGMSMSDLIEGIALYDAKRSLVWANDPARDYYKRLSVDIQRLMHRAGETRRLQAQTFALGEGERVSVQAVPQPDGYTHLLLKPMQNYADATQFYEHFIRRLVHDMRNPLAAIIAHASNLHTAKLPELDAYQRTAETIEHEAQRLTRLVDSMLFDARLSYVSLATQLLDLRDIVEDMLFQYDERAIREGKTLEVEMLPKPALIEGDRDLLTRALSNLIDNSLKYSPPGGRITLLLEEATNGYHLQVCDTGDGIPNDLLPDRVFEALVRGKVGQGSGLGLAIVKKIIEMHHGTIRAQSTPNQGTMMVVWLPK